MVAEKGTTWLNTQDTIKQLRIGEHKKTYLRRQVFVFKVKENTTNININIIITILVCNLLDCKNIVKIEFQFTL